MATKLTIVSFYEKVTEILSDYQERILTESNAELKLERLIAKAKEDGLEINMTTAVLHAINQNPEPVSTDDDDDYGKRGCIFLNKLVVVIIVVSRSIVMNLLIMRMTKNVAKSRHILLKFIPVNRNFIKKSLNPVC